jgi:hypothetical protein
MPLLVLLPLLVRYLPVLLLVLLLPVRYLLLLVCLLLVLLPEHRLLLRLLLLYLLGNLFLQQLLDQQRRLPLIQHLWPVRLRLCLQQIQFYLKSDLLLAVEAVIQLIVR